MFARKPPVALPREVDHLVTTVHRRCFMDAWHANHARRLLENVSSKTRDPIQKMFRGRKRLPRSCRGRDLCRLPSSRLASSERQAHTGWAGGARWIDHPSLQGFRSGATLQSGSQQLHGKNTQTAVCRCMSTRVNRDEAPELLG